MKTAAIDALLSVAVLAAWLAAAGFARLRVPLDRLHCVAFVNIAVTLPVIAAGIVADGVSDRSAKLLLIGAGALVIGAATAHASGRALLQREEAGDQRR